MLQERVSRAIMTLNSDGAASAIDYYKNSNNGNTSRIKKDSEWYYT